MEGEAEFRAATRKERPCFAAECGRDPFGHTRALQGHFPILRLRTQLRAATRKERSCFAAECGLGRLGHTRTLEALEQPHEKNGPVLLQNAARALWAHTSTPGPIFRS